ncbi:response regulator [uncultured Bacteroides sp.]|uniref:hybrid sensor histidine kinase/response regulator transcription factor n=1 Tax=uncultured Bacteroides sp. TaxID=162156 RepID=UPI002AABB390|nr:response regulator [uncultured Bacteroides sp.]
MKSLFLLFAFLLIPFTGYCVGDLNFYNINDTYGIANRETTSICKDADGFIWIASKTGIMRLTDSDCRVYQLPYESMAVVSVEVIWQENHLMAFTNQGEIFWYNPRQDSFERFFNFSKQVKSANLWLFNLEVDADGGLWIASSLGLYYYKDNRCTLIAQLPSGAYHTTRYDADHLIATAPEGIFIVDTKKHHVQRWSGKMDIQPSSLLLDRAMNRLWIGTYSSGLYYFDCTSQKLHVATVPNFPQQCIKSIELVRDSTLWCGIDGRGVWVVSHDGSRKLSTYQEDVDNQFSICGNGVYDVYYESPGRIWVCSVTGGTSVADLSSPTVVQLRHSINNHNSLINNHIHALIEDSRGQLWTGTNSGLSCWKPHSDKWVNYFEERDGETYIVLSLCEDTDGNIWAGTYAHGVYVIDSKSLRIIAHHTQPTGILSKAGFVFDILKDNEGDMWLGGISGEIIRYNHLSRKFETFPKEPVYAMAEWGDRMIILGCNYGLVMLDKETKKLTKILTDNMIQDVVVVQDKIWAGSSGGGLFSYNIRTHTVKRYDTSNGLTSNYVNSLIYADGYLWLGTENGLCRFNTIDKTITTYPSPMNISTISYNSDACFQLQNGMFAWGTSDGVIMQDPKYLYRHKSTSHIYIQDILLSGRSIRQYPDLLPEIPLDSVSEITLDHQQNNVTLNILPLGDDSRTARFSWKMEGVDNDWNTLTDQRFINYTNLNPGTYRLVIRLYNHELIAQRLLTIRVTPAFWDTWWFRLISVLFIGVLAYFLFQFYINRLNQQHSEDKLRFFTNIAHDLRTALTLIKAPIEELNQVNSLSKHDKEYLHLATEQMRRLTSVATQLLDFQKIDIAKEPFHPAMTDAVALAGCRVSMFESIAAAKQIQINYHYNIDTCLISIDIDMMERVIDNLLSNAVKYSHEHSTIEVYFQADEHEWKLSVTDYGIGISHKAQSNLFHEFYRSENAINAKIAGSGIGLSMAKALVELHNGKISVESEEGKGSTFQIVIPICKSEIQQDTDKATDDSSENNPSGNYSTGDMRILIVEDNDDLRHFMIRPLGKHFQVATASDGVEAWEYIQKEIPDLIVSDIMMPRMDGFELCHQVKSNFDTSHIPIILLTALSEKTTELQGLGLGADDYVTKPFDMKMLTQRIISIIRNRRVIGAKYIASDSITNAKDETENPLNTLNDAFVKQALEVVELHLDDANFGKDHFAKEMGVSTSLLFKKMKALTGMSIVDFIRSIRMKHAMRLIKENQYTIGEIAYKCGFSSIGYFSTSFKKHFGKSPTDFMP